MWQSHSVASEAGHRACGTQLQPNPAPRASVKSGIHVRTYEPLWRAPSSAPAPALLSGWWVSAKNNAPLVDRTGMFGSQRLGIMHSTDNAVCDLICVTTLKWQKDGDGEEWWSAPKTAGRGGSKNSVREAVTMREYCQFWTKWWLQKCSCGKGTHIVQCQVLYSSVVLGRTWEVLGTFLCSLWNFHGLYHSKTLKIT